MSEPALMKIHEVSKMLNVSRGTVYALFRRGLLRKTKIGKATRIRRKDVEDLIANTPRARQGHNRPA